MRASSSAIGLLLLAGAVPAWADVIAPTGRPAVVGVTVTRFEKGQLFWRGLDGSEFSRPIEEISYLQITGWPALNTAERQLRENHPHQAFLGYQSALMEIEKITQRSENTPDASLDRVTLLRCRLLRAAEMDGQHETAVRVYIQLLEREGGLAMRSLQPRRIPDVKSPQFQAARALLSGAIERHGSDAFGRVLSEWYSLWPDTAVPADARASPVPRADAGLGGAIPRVQGLNRAGRFDDALGVLRELHTRTYGLDRAETYYWEAQTRLGRAAASKPSAADAAADRRRAGMGFMRVAVHFPESSRAPESLYLAGRICEEDARTDLARALWTEAITRYPPGSAHVERARQELSRLSASRAAATSPAAAGATATMPAR